jgi:hypothetical protein
MSSSSWGEDGEEGRDGDEVGKGEMEGEVFLFFILSRPRSRSSSSRWGANLPERYRSENMGKKGDTISRKDRREKTGELGKVEGRDRIVGRI